VETPAATATHKPIPHIAVVEKLIEALSFRQIGVVREEYAVSADGMKMFGVMDLSSGFEGCRFAIGLRNSHDKSFRLSCTVGLRVFVCENLAFHGDNTPVLTKHPMSFSLIDCVAVGADRMQRNFERIRRQVEAWRKCELTDVTAKVAFYEAFVEGKLEAPKHLARTVHDLYFERTYDEFKSRTIWSRPTPSLRRSRHSNRSHSSRTLTSWASSWKRASHSRSSIRACRLGWRASGFNRVSRDLQRARWRWLPASSMGSECSPQFGRLFRRSLSYE